MRRNLNKLLPSLSNKKADVLDIVDNNWKFDVLLDGVLLSHTTNLNGFVLLPQYKMLSQSTEREEISNSGCHF